MAPVIKAKDLYKCYPGFPPVLRGVNIEVEPGEMVAIMGPSGCGKSTMLHVLGMLHAPDSGSLQILDQNVLSLDNEGTAAFRRGNMGFVMQASNLFEHSTVFENVEFPLIYENVPPEERWERVIRALDLVRLSGRVHYRSNRLSGGEQQRVAIARAMVNNPKILLADEPTGALDARTSKVIMENFRNLCHKGGVAMVMVTHDPKMAEYCDSIYTLEDGVLICQKHSPPRLSLDPEHNFLSPPKPLVAGALVAWQFPASQEPGILELAVRMNELRLLGRIYALAKNSIFAGPGNYSLPLVVQRMSFWEKFRTFCSVLGGNSEARKFAANVPPVRGLAGKLRRLTALARGVRLGQWLKKDGTAFLYAAGTREVAQAAWAAATMEGIPFAFALKPEEIAKIGPNIKLAAKGAAFITCSTQAMEKAFREAAPDLEADKILLLPALPVFTRLDEDLEPGLPPQPGQATKIMLLADETEPKAIKILLTALKNIKSLNFQLKICTRQKLSLAFKIFGCGLSKKTAYFKPAPDRIAETFREADIFITSPPRMDLALAMPWQLTEAMALGLPIVTTGITPGMASALVAGENCIVAGDSSAMQKALDTLIQKPEEGQELGKKARIALRKYINADEASAALSARIEKAVAKK